MDGLQSAVGVLLTLSFAGLVWSAFQPIAVLWMGLRLDRVTSVVAVLVSGVGLAALRYASRCLEGDPRRLSLLRWMACTMLAAWFLALADGFLVLLVAWVAVGIGLQRLFRFRSECTGIAKSSSRVLVLSIVGDGLLAAALPVLAIASLAALHALLPLLERRSIGLSLRVHAASSFFVWILVARLIDRLRSAGGNDLEGVTRA